MKYMLLMHWNPSKMPSTPEEQQAIAPPVWFAFQQEATEAGVFVTSKGLAPVADATTVRVREGKMLTTDGPFETYEHLGGEDFQRPLRLDRNSPAVGTAVVALA